MAGTAAPFLARALAPVPAPARSALPRRAHRMDRRAVGRVAACIVLASLARPARALLMLDAPRALTGSRHHAFYEQLRQSLAVLAESPQPHVRQLLAAVAAAPAAVTFRPVTDDPATWASDGDRERGHTQPVDGRPKNEGRTRPTGADVYLPPWSVDMRTPRWHDGLLVHELVHALDLTTGHYHPDVRVRERRAVFMQNLWRDSTGTPLHGSYHGEFPTLDYQEAKREGRIEEYAAYVFHRSDFPHTPANGPDPRGQESR